ncbi:amino acid ABC transporter permease [Skermanella stibiiresistens SB22]|uniref:Amino acid ABC transporter permease n=1 Tax=Skermanella stibiiresistens SB22 TaxID=1385369 RepID=W9H6N0_9PROT|nr:amino acid ABC transporter permease [Skermanella stibiiresistens]EWY41674.1 amino acid ABC transporter permease [Skermanella stibiiresistens SB22]
MPEFGPNQFVFLLHGAVWTIALSVLSLVIGAVFAFVVALCRISGSRTVRAISAIYVQAIQGTPLMVLMLISYFGLNILGVDVPALVGATIAMTLYVSAFLGEVWRGSLLSIPRTQWEASECLGHSRAARMRHIILPQAVKISIPPTVTFMVQIVKNTSLASIIGFVELTQAGKLVNNSTFQPFVCFLCVAALYFAVCYPISLWGRHLEKQYNVVR